MNNPAVNYPEIKLCGIDRPVGGRGGRARRRRRQPGHRGGHRPEGDPFGEPSDVGAAIAAAKAAFPKWWDAGPVKLPGQGSLLRAAALRCTSGAGRDPGRVMTLEERRKPARRGHRRSALGGDRAAVELRGGAPRLRADHPEQGLDEVAVRPGDPGRRRRSRRSCRGTSTAGGPMRKISANLSAVSCSIVIKPSEEVPGTVSLIARAFEDAGLPPGVLNVLFGCARTRSSPAR